MATAPFQIIVAPFTAYVAVVGTAFPAVNAAPSGSWTILGQSGDRDMNEDGVHVVHNQTVDLHRFLGSTGPRKATRSEEEHHVMFKLHDMTLEMYAIAMSQTVVILAGPPATKEIPLYKGLDVQQFALLLRGASPYSATGVMQYQCPVAVHVGEPDITYNKTDPAGLDFDWLQLEDPAAASPGARFGKLIAATT